MQSDDELKTRGIRIGDPQWDVICAEAKEWGQRPSSFARDGLWVYTLLMRMARVQSLVQAAEIVWAAVRAGRGTALKALIDEQLAELHSRQDRKKK
jgi:hypothetical protein